MDKIKVLQLGKRHEYSIPSFFEEQKLLDRFYTNSNSSLGLGNSISKLPIKFLSDQINKRIIPESLISKTKTIDRGALFAKISEYISDSYLRLKIRRKYCANISNEVMRLETGYNNKAILYSMGREFSRLNCFQRNLGAITISDIYIDPMSEWRENQVDWKDEYINDESRIPSRALKSSLSWYKELLLGTEYFTCPSQIVADSLSQMFHISDKKIKIIPYGSKLQIDESCVSSMVENRIYLLNIRKRIDMCFIGRDFKRKGLLELLQALIILKKRNISFKLIVLGVDESKLPNIKYYKSILGSNFIVMGDLPHPEIYQYLQNSQIFVLPSIGEGFPSAIAESFSAGLPVLTTKFSGVPSPLRKASYILTSNKVEDLVSALTRLHQDRVFLSEMTKSAGQQSKYFHLSSWKNRLISGMEDLVYG